MGKVMVENSSLNADLGLFFSYENLIYVCS